MTAVSDVQVGLTDDTTDDVNPTAWVRTGLGDIQRVFTSPAPVAGKGDPVASDSGDYTLAEKLPGVDAAVAAGATRALVQVTGGSVARGTSGAPPTGAFGFVIPADSYVELTTAIDDVRLIALADDPIVLAEYT